MTACACVRPIRMATFCGRCYHPIVTVEPSTRPPSVGTGPVPTAGERAAPCPSPATLDPWETDPTDLIGYPVDVEPFDDDYAEAWNQTEGGRIKAAFEKRTGRA